MIAAGLSMIRMFSAAMNLRQILRLTSRRTILASRVWASVLHFAYDGEMCRPSIILHHCLAELVDTHSGGSEPVGRQQVLRFHHHPVVRAQTEARQ